MSPLEITCKSSRTSSRGSSTSVSSLSNDGTTSCIGSTSGLRSASSALAASSGRALRSAATTYVQKTGPLSSPSSSRRYAAGRRSCSASSHSASNDVLPQPAGAVISSTWASALARRSTTFGLGNHRDVTTGGTNFIVRRGAEGPAVSLSSLLMGVDRRFPRDRHNPTGAPTGAQRAARDR